MFLPHTRTPFSFSELGFFDVPYPALPFAVTWVAGALVPAAGAFERLASLVGQALALVGGAYQGAPVLVLVLSVLVVLPVLALISFAAQARVRSRRRQSALRAAERRANAGSLIKEEETPGDRAWTTQAWLTVEGRPGGTMPLAGEVIRIGRHQENDIRLADRSVHRYHAVIERTSDEAFVITDMSGKDGNGVRINGERTRRAQLADGDVIELGRAKLRFENAPI